MKNIPAEMRGEIFASWPGPHTWLLPVRERTSRWLRGDHDSIAVRVTGHRYAKALCRTAGMAVVSTSANRSQCATLRSAENVLREFGDEVDCIMEGSIGSNRSPSVICDGVSGEFIRK